MDDVEYNCFQKLESDALAEFIPKVDRIVIQKEDGKHYMEMQDLLYGFSNPFIMDIKIGVRSFLENEYNSEGVFKPRADLYTKLIEYSPDEPNELEHKLKAISKRRYMSWRDKSTSTSSLGFRIEAIKVRIKIKRQFIEILYF